MNGLDETIDALRQRGFVVRSIDLEKRDDKVSVTLVMTRDGKVIASIKLITMEGPKYGGDTVTTFKSTPAEQVRNYLIPYLDENYLKGGKP